MNHDATEFCTLQLRLLKRVTANGQHFKRTQQLMDVTIDVHDIYWTFLHIDTIVNVRYST